MNKPTIIQLLGAARAGKDWTAEQLKLAFESQGKSVAIMSYAAPMKRITATLFGISLDQLDTLKNDTTNSPILVCNSLRLLLGEPYNEHITSRLNMRTFLQRLGNEAIKPIFGDDVWVNLMQQAISKSFADVIIIPDCRFMVELATVGGTTIRVVNNSLPPPVQHASERELLDFVANITIDNTGYSLTTEDIMDLISRIPTSH